MPVWIPPQFANLIARARRGEQPRTSVTSLLQWFQHSRRGTKVNRYIRDVLEQEGVVFVPDFEVPFPGDQIVLKSAAYVPPPIPTPLAPLPYPVAVFGAIIRAQTDASRRVESRLDGIERAIAFLVYAVLAALKTYGNGQYPEAVRTLLTPRLGAPVSFGSWVELSWRLASLAPSSSDPVFMATAAMIVKPGAPSALSLSLSEKVVPLRNRFAHGSSVPAAEFEAAEPMLEEVWKSLRAALSTLFQMKLVCVHRVEPGTTSAYRYELRLLHGSVDFFEAFSMESDEKFALHWAHLVRPGFPALRLSPGFYCVEDHATHRVQISYARSLALDPGQKVALLSVVGAAESKSSLPL